MKTKKFWTQFMAAIAGLSSVATLMSFLNQQLTSDLSVGWQFMLGACILLLSLGYARWMSSDKSTLRLAVNIQSNVIVEEGDLFCKSGVIVIPFNEYFDTHLGDNIISEHSIHGEFLHKYYKHTPYLLDHKIEVALQHIPNCGSVDRAPGKSTKYPLGTCVDVKEGNNTYVLFAFTHFDEYNKAYIGKDEFGPTINNLLDHLAEVAEDKPVFMPLFGTHFSRLRLSPQRVLSFILDTIDFNDERVFLGDLHIEIKSLKESNIDLNALSKNYSSKIN